MNVLKTRMRRMLPQSLVKLMGGCLRIIRGQIDSRRSPERVFTEIYRKQLWGGVPGGICSGGGSHDARVTGSYLDMVRDHCRSDSHGELTFVDLGCGDMEVGRQLIPLCRLFIGVDVVKFVIDRHQEAIGSDSVRFAHLDIVDGDLPDGDICFVRQVFQHLSNTQVAKVLPKLRKYRKVYITEHIPSGSSPFIPNLDKPQGAGIRLDVGSGIDLNASPFSIPEGATRVVLEVRGNNTGCDGDSGVIRTILYTPGFDGFELGVTVGNASHQS